MSLLLATADGVRALCDVDADAPVIGVIPGDDVALHHLKLLESGEAARLEEARMRAVDLAAQPLEDVHVAVGPADAEGASWVALIDRTRMAGHLAHFRNHGVEPRHLVPAPLLLDPAEPDGALARLDERVVVRTPELAALVEPDLAPLVAGPAWKGRFYLLPDYAPAEPAEPPLDLLQGEFAPRLRWWRLKSFQIPAALLTLLVLLLLAAPALVERARTAAAVRGYDQAVVELAAQTLGRRPPDASAASTALAAARRKAEGGTVAARLSAVAATVETVPGTRIEAVRLQPNGWLRVSLGGPAGAINQVGLSLAGSAFDTRPDGTDLLMGERRAGRATSDSELAGALLRFVEARSDAALVALGKARPPIGDRAAVAGRLTALLAAAGLAEASVIPGPAGLAVSIPAARATALLPFIADAERLGLRVSALAISRNADETLNAHLMVSA
jgi:general secretion pathway protein L